MSSLALKKAREEYARFVEQARKSKAMQTSDQAAADLESLQSKLYDESAAAGTDAKVRDGAASARDAIDRAHEQRVSEIESALADAISSGVEMRKQIADLENALIEEQKKHKSFEFAPDGKLRKFSPDAHVRLMTTPSKDESIREMQRAHDRLQLLGAFVKFGRSKSQRVIKGVNRVEDLKSYKEMESMVRAMYSTGSTLGDELVPTIVSSQVHELWEAERRLAGAVQMVQMPSNPWNMPTTTANPSIVILSEKSADDASNITPGNISTSAGALSAVKLGARLVWSGELDEDSVVAMSDLVQRAFVSAYNGAVEDCMLNGDTTATHQDTGLSLASNSHLKAWKGLRWSANSSQKVDCSSTTDAKILKMISSMGEYASDMSQVILVPSVKAFLMYIVGSSAFANWYSVGEFQAPSNMTGSTGVFYGCPVIPSGKILQNMNASGVYDGSTLTTTSIVAFNKNEWVLGERRGFSIKVREDIDTDQLVTVCSGRHTFVKLPASAATSEAVGYNIT